MNSKLRSILPIMIAVLAFVVGLLVAFGPWRQPIELSNPKHFSFEPLTFLALVLAFLAYVAVAEEKLIRRLPPPTAPKADFVRGAAAYVALVVGDLFLIWLSIDLLRWVVPPSAIDKGTPYEHRVAAMVWTLAIGFASMHVFNWARGLLHLFYRARDEQIAVLDIKAAQYFVVPHGGKRYLAAHLRLNPPYSVHWEEDSSANGALHVKTESAQSSEAKDFWKVQLLVTNVSRPLSVVNEDGSSVTPIEQDLSKFAEADRGLIAAAIESQK